MQYEEIPIGDRYAPYVVDGVDCLAGQDINYEQTEEGAELEVYGQYVPSDKQGSLHHIAHPHEIVTEIGQ